MSVTSQVFPEQPQMQSGKSNLKESSVKPKNSSKWLGPPGHCRQQPFLHTDFIAQNCQGNGTDDVK